MNSSISVNIGEDILNINFSTMTANVKDEVIFIYRARFNMTAID